MKRSSWVFLTLGLAACGHRSVGDPCDPESFAEASCRDAINNNGYYSNGVFIRHIYAAPYPYYYQRYGSYVGGGGSDSSGSGTVQRGGFGSTGSGGEGVGE